MGWIDDLWAQMQPGAAPPTPFGGAGGMPNPFGGPPNPFGGGAGAWPAGVPNPLGLPSPGDAFNTVSNWFTNPYNTNGSVPDPSNTSGINPFGTQVSGGRPRPPPTPWEKGPPKTYGNPFVAPQFNGYNYGAPAASFSGGSGGPLPGMAWRDPTPAYGDMPAANMTPKRAPPVLKEPTRAQAPQTIDRWGGGVGVGGPFGMRHQQATPSVGGAPNWHDVPLWGGGKP